MQLFVTIAHHASFLLKATGDVAGGWRQNERGNGFFGSGSIPYPGNRSIEITANIRVRPFHNLQQFRDFPQDLSVAGDLMLQNVEGFGVFAVKAGKVGVLIVAGALRDELEQNEDKPTHFDRVILCRKSSGVHLKMNVSVCVRSATPEPIGDIPEWDTQFFQGGLPSLGRRRP